MRSLEISVPDPLFVEAQRAATAQGFEDVASYVLSLISLDIEADEESYSALTEDQIALIESRRADVAAGNGLTSDQVRAELGANRADWLRENRR